MPILYTSEDGKSRIQLSDNYKVAAKKELGAD